MKILDKLFPKNYCQGCGEEIKYSVFSIHKKDRVFEFRCINNVLGYDYTDEKFEPSSKVYFFKEKFKNILLREMKSILNQKISNNLPK